MRDRLAACLKAVLKQTEDLGLATTSLLRRRRVFDKSGIGAPEWKKGPPLTEMIMPLLVRTGTYSGIWLSPNSGYALQKWWLKERNKLETKEVIGLKNKLTIEIHLAAGEAAKWETVSGARIEASADIFICVTAKMTKNKKTYSWADAFAGPLGSLMKNKLARASAEWVSTAITFCTDAYGKEEKTQTVNDALALGHQPERRTRDQLIERLIARMRQGADQTQTPAPMPGRCPETASRGDWTPGQGSDDDWRRGRCGCDWSGYNWNVAPRCEGDNQTPTAAPMPDRRPDTASRGDGLRGRNANDGFSDALGVSSSREIAAASREITAVKDWSGRYGPMAASMPDRRPETASRGDWYRGRNANDWYSDRDNAAAQDWSGRYGNVAPRREGGDQTPTAAPMPGRRPETASRCDWRSGRNANDWYSDRDNAAAQDWSGRDPCETDTRANNRIFAYLM